MFKVIFEGVRGTSYLGDIAIDDVSLTAGSCSQGMDLVSVRLGEMFMICNDGNCDNDLFNKRGWKVDDY